MNQNKTTYHRGKIARLPHGVREEVNLRLVNGETSVTILPWLNGLPEVQAVLQAQFQGVPVSRTNLSYWRRGGYQDWLRRCEPVLQMRQLGQLSAKFNAGAVPDLGAGNAAILQGCILQILELVKGLVQSGKEETEEDRQEKVERSVKTLTRLSSSVAQLRRGDQGAEQLRLGRERLAHSVVKLGLTMRDQAKEKMAQAWEEIKRSPEQEKRSQEQEDAVVEMLGRKLFGNNW